MDLNSGKTCGRSYSNFSGANGSAGVIYREAIPIRPLESNASQQAKFGWICNSGKTSPGVINFIATKWISGR
jgi:hypothetical protein